MLQRQFIAIGISALVMLAAPSVRAGGTIDTAGATIESGAAPTQGVVTIDPAAPVGTIPTLPAFVGPGGPPTLTGSMPTMPSFGDGSDGAFTASAGTVPIAPGTHQFTSFTVTNGASVTVSGATTILVQGECSIAGSVTSDVNGGSITLRCGGDFTLVSRIPASLVQTSQASSPIEIVAGGLAWVGSDVTNLDARVNAALSDVGIDAYGVSETQASIRLRSGRVLAPMGAITLRADGWISSGGTQSTRPGLVDCLGPLTIRSFTSNLTANSNGDFFVGAGAATLECAEWFFIGGFLDVGGTGAMTLTSVNGPFGSNGRITTVEGDVTLRCGGNVDIYGSMFGSSGAGSVSVHAGGTARLRSNEDMTSGAGDVELLAVGTISLTSNAQISSDTSIRVVSSGGDVRIFDAAAITGAGAALVHASAVVFIGEPSPPEKRPSVAKTPSLGTSVVVDAASVDIAAGGDVTIDAATARATDGAFRVLSGGAVVVSRTISASGDVELRSIDGDIDVAGAEVRSDDNAADGGVFVETWRPGGTIDAVGATIQSGASAQTSGPVSVLVHDPGASPPPVVESYILPKKIKARIDAARPARTRVVAQGFFDLGPSGIDLTDPMTIVVGSRVFDIAGFVSERNGRRFSHKEDALIVRIIPNRKGSSRARFRLLARGESMAGAVAEEGEATLEFRSGEISGEGTVMLAKSTYKFGRRRGALVEPNLFPARTKAKLVGAGKDSLKLVLGLATQGVTPAAAPDVHVEFGADFVLDVASAEFERRGERYVAPGVVLDYVRETLTVKAKDVSLGDGFAEGPQPVIVKVALGDSTREVRVRMVRQGKKLRY